MLRNWFLQEEEDGDDASSSSSKLPRIQLLDGGVSTHLEQLIQSDDDTNTTTTTSTDANKQTRPAFAYRQLWSSSLLLTDPDRLRQGHLDWLRVGQVNLLSTVTYQCHYEASLWPVGASMSASEGDSTCGTSNSSTTSPHSTTAVIRDAAHMTSLLHQAVDLAREALAEYKATAGPTNHRFHGIIASSGCFGAALANGAEYTGDYSGYTAADVRRFHAAKWRTFQAMREIDGIALETVPSLLECQVLRDLLTTPPHGNDDDDDDSNNNSTSNHDKACWIVLSCRNGHQLHNGTPVRQALRVLDEIPVDRVQALGFNCCHAHHLSALLTHLLDLYYGDSDASREDTRRPRKRPRGIVLYPNAGELWDAATADWRPGTATPDWVPTLRACLTQIDDRAATAVGLPPPRIVVGGCCRTTPAHLAALRQAVEEHLASTSAGQAAH